MKQYPKPPKGISIHALVKRATNFTSSSSYSVIDFNPRPRKEGDPLIETKLLDVKDFNPRPRKEGDSFHYLYYTVLLYFNPRPRKEGDLDL